ncbi:hypothetical protein CFP56_021971 [Quercus suber]|uniref:Uncharacterized protein n=1 Tax=Quercus suber TaxID=58331 RepID=A0AAW0KDI9_QUESU
MEQSSANAFVGDCSIGLSLKVPEGVKLDTWTLRSIVEEIWSKKDVNDSGYFGKIEFRDSLLKVESALEN